jgi:DNA-binding GntR family transcriptional regulator
MLEGMHSLLGAQRRAKPDEPLVRPGVTVIRDRLRDAILSGDLPPGAVATQIRLAEQFGVSRTPLREALRMLELEGLILREPNGRFRVSSMSVDDIEELCVMRISVEATAVRLTVPVFGNADHAELEGLLAQIDRFALLEDWVGIEVPHRAFHAKITSRAGERIVEQLARLWDHATRYREASFRKVAETGGFDVRQAEHRGMLDAIEAYDADAAAAYIALQIGRTAIEVVADIDPDHPMTKVRTTLATHTGSTELRVPPHRGSQRRD